LKKVLRILLTVLLMTMLLAGLAVMLFVPPIAAVWEAWDMLHMRATATGVVRKMEVEGSSHGTSRPVVAYSYQVGGKEYESTRYLPGFLGNWPTGAWSGGGNDVRGLVPGQAVTVHYDPADPWRACLLYGWFKWSVGLPLFILGGVVHARWAARSPKALVGRAIGIALAICGFACLAGPDAVRPDWWTWYLLIVVGAITVALAYQTLWARRGGASGVAIV
jgi:hypothetical protein